MIERDYSEACNRKRGSGREGERGGGGRQVRERKGEIRANMHSKMRSYGTCFGVILLLVLFLP